MRACKKEKRYEKEGERVSTEHKPDKPEQKVLVNGEREIIYRGSRTVPEPFPESRAVPEPFRNPERFRSPFRNPESFRKPHDSTYYQGILTKRLIISLWERVKTAALRCCTIRVINHNK